MPSGSATEPDKGSAAVASGSGDKGSAAVASGSGDKGSAAVEITTIKLTVTSTPAGAEILLDGKDTGKKTGDAPLELPQSKRQATITLRLKGYDDFTIKNVAFDQPELTENAILFKKVVPTGHVPTGHVPTGHGHGSGSGSSTGSKPCDTCLERPD